ncbi:MAG: hypothetical protein AABX29_03475 [Nanoarchaeota archaeon]
MIIFLANFKKIFKVLGKTFLVVSVFVAVISILAYFISKDKPDLNSNANLIESRREIYEYINDPVLNKTKDGKTVLGFYRASICSLVGEACTDNPEDGDKNAENSLFGNMSKLTFLPIAYPAASGVYWTISSLRNSGLIPNTYAAEGIGFASIRPFQSLWKIFRNVSYSLLVLVIITIGFLIMFRIKINPQTIISLENSLPRIVVTLIFITFSFAIAGFMIDLMYIVSALSISVLANTSAYSESVKTNLLIGNAGTLLGEVFWNVDILNLGYALFSIIPGFLQGTVRIAVVIIAMHLLGWIYNPFKQIINGDIAAGGWGGGLLKWALSLFAYTALSAIFGLLAPLILSFVILLITGLLVFGKIFFLLLATYIRIMISIIFAPIILLGNAFPGKNTFGNWIKNLSADLLAFPVVITLILVSHIIVSTPATQGTVWQPPFLYSRVSTTFTVIIGVGILFAIPNIIGSLRKVLGIKESPFSIGFSTFTGGAKTGEGLSGLFNNPYLKHDITMKGLKLIPGVKKLFGG